MGANSDRVSDMLNRAKPMGPKDRFAAYQAANAKQGMVAGFRTTPDKFWAYMERRLAEDAKAKGHR